MFQVPPGRVVHLLGQACDALAEAHAFGFFHRNLKPTNLMVAHRGRLHDTVKLLDFGLDQDVTGKPVPAETARFMPPEQATGCKVDARCDIYALGAVAYYLITGRPVFPATNLMQLVVAHSRDPVVPRGVTDKGLAHLADNGSLVCLRLGPGITDKEDIVQKRAIRRREFAHHLVEHHLYPDPVSPSSALKRAS